MAKGKGNSIAELWDTVELIPNVSEEQRSKAKEILLTYEAHDLIEMLGL